MTFWPYINGWGVVLRELDDLVYVVLRKHPRGMHLNFITRDVRAAYTANGPMTWETGTVEREQVHQALLRLAIRGFVYRIGTQRFSFPAWTAPSFDPNEVDDDAWPKWRPISLLEAIARASA